jgi:hypothetical protein
MSDTPRNQILASSGLPESCPKKRRRTEVSVPYNGSADAVGRHNKTQNSAAFGAGAISSRLGTRPRAACGERAPFIVRPMSQCFRPVT